LKFSKRGKPAKDGEKTIKDEQKKLGNTDPDNLLGKQIIRGRLPASLVVGNLQDKHQTVFNLLNNRLY